MYSQVGLQYRVIMLRRVMVNTNTNGFFYYYYIIDLLTAVICFGIIFCYLMCAKHKRQAKVNQILIKFRGWWSQN